MSKITFIYHHNNYEMILKENHSINSILDNYAKILKENLNDFFFLYKGKNIFLFNEYLLNPIKNKNIIIMVFKRTKEFNNDINNIICPNCKNLAFLNIKDDKIISIECNNNHKHIYSSMNEFMNNQKIDESKLNCNICTNKINLYNDKNIFCSFDKYICQLCIKKHNHNLIE